MKINHIRSLGQNQHGAQHIIAMCNVSIFSNRHLILRFLITILLGLTSYCVNAQVPASSYGFNYFERQWFTVNNNGAGYSFYAGVWPIMQQYPGPDHYQLGLPSTWMIPFPTGNEPPGFYNTIEGGLGWWGDTRFATETPKFIMGGVANGFSQWANGVGAGSSQMLPDGHRDWSVPGGKYGVAQLSKNLLWPPDGLNMEQGANGEFLGYGYHPLPLTDVMPETYGFNFSTGNQCWTLFLNTADFKGPVTFFIPTFWTETALNDPGLEGLFLDTRPTDKNQAFAIEHAESPALIGFDNSEAYARILPFVFPATTPNRSEVIRDIRVFTKSAKWDEVESWFSGGPVPPTAFQTAGTENVIFTVNPAVDGHIKAIDGNPIDGSIDYDSFAEKIMNSSHTAAGFEWDTTVVNTVDGNFIMPEFYKLNESDEWEPIEISGVPVSTGLLDNEPEISPRNDTIAYLTPIEPDCPWQDPDGPWNNPGPSAGPFTVQLGDGSKLTYYWYKFIDQPAIIHANLPDTMLQNLQERVEQIHTNWLYTDNYLPDLDSGTLVSLDPALIVTPPSGMEIGYVPIVTRQELDTATVNVVDRKYGKDIKIYPNPSNGFIIIAADEHLKGEIVIYDATGKLVHSVNINAYSNQLELSLSDGMYFLQVRTHHVYMTKKIIIERK
jgi:hypothetical protein